MRVEVHQSSIHIIKMDKKYKTAYKSNSSLTSAIDGKLIHNRSQKEKKFKLCLGKTLEQGISCLFEFEVQDQDDGNNKNSNDGTDHPLVPVHPPRNGSQYSLTLTDVVIHSMKLTIQEEP